MTSILWQNQGVDLFQHRARKAGTGQPLAERMRPRTLAEVVGQVHVLGEGKLLASAIARDQVPSMILWGPPGSGKTTLARVIAETTGAAFAQLSAVSGGVKELRELIAEAEKSRDLYGRRSLLFIDEIHRWSKAQQDALLPAVEAGTLTLIGATTENPSFEINSALLSRVKVVVLHALEDAEVDALVERALTDRERGLGKQPPGFAPGARERLIAEAEGDARRALTTLEIAAQLAPETIDIAALEQALQKRTLRYDKAGDQHYAVVSAFIKSMRGSDPDAAVYWMVRMLEAGEDPLFVVRRMVIFAAEDVGLADPQALAVATAALDATRFVGLPEAVLPMTEAALYLATAPKSNSALTTYANARKDVLERGALPVPPEIQNAPTPLMKELGHGRGYRYPHDFEGAYVEAEYLPEGLRGRRYYQPSEHGREAEVKARVEAIRERVKKPGT